MHANRLLYSLPEYQRKLEKNASSFALLLRDEEKGEDFLIKPKPRSLWHPEYQCDYLAPRISKLKKALLSFKYNFLTLTYWTKYMSAEEVAKRHKTDINKFFRLLRKIYGKVSYAYIVEVTEKFYVHFHIFIDKKVSEKIARRVWRGLTTAWRVQLKKIDNTAKAVQYVNKYVHKVADGEIDKLTFMYDNIDRFFGCSIGFFKDALKGDPKSLMRLISHFYSDGDFTEFLNSKKLIGKLISSEKAAELLSSQRKGFRFEYDDEGGLVAKMVHFRESNDLVDFFIDFTQNRQSSFTNALNSEKPLYVSYAE